MEKMRVRARGSCGMPMRSADEFGTEADGTRSRDSCTHCYRDGAFTDPGLTLDEAVSRYAPMMATTLDMPPGKAELMVRLYLSALPRWY